MLLPEEKSVIEADKDIDISVDHFHVNGTQLNSWIRLLRAKGQKE